MRLIIVSACMLSTRFLFGAAPAPVEAALTVERLRLDDPGKPGYALVNESADRFSEYFKLAKSATDRKRLYIAWRTYSDRVRVRARQRLNELWEQTQREMNRPRGGGRRA